MREGNELMGELNSAFNRAVWFDIPVANLERAAAFYEAVLNIKVHIEQFDDFQFGVLDHEQGNGGCLIPNESAISGSQGILVYMNVDQRIRDAITQVEPHGGKIIEPIHSIGPHGFRAIILDSEGNRLALHSNLDA